MNYFFDANESPKGPDPQGISSKYMATWRDSDGNIHHDQLFKAETNNQAEYGAILFVLRHLITSVEQGLLPTPWEATIHGDSQLVIYQIQGIYKVKNEGIRPLWLEALNLIRILTDLKIHVTFTWIPRETNNQALGLEN